MMIVDLVTILPGLFDVMGCRVRAAQSICIEQLGGLGGMLYPLRMLKIFRLLRIQARRRARSRCVPFDSTRSVPP